MKKTILLLSLLSLSALADITMYYSKDTPFRIGRSNDINFPIARKDNCLVEEAAVWSTVDQGVGSISYRSKFIKDRDELTENMSFDLKLSAKAKFKVISGSAKFDNKFSRDYTGFTDTLNYLIQAKYNYGEKELLNPTLKPKYQALIDSGNHTEFIKRCGTHFAIAARHGVEINVLMSIKNLSRNEKKNFTSKFNLSLNAGPNYSGTADSEFIKNYNQIKKSTETSLIIDTIGGPDQNFQGFGATNDLDGLLKAIKSYMAAIKKETAHPVEFVLVSMERFGLQMPTYDSDKDEFFVEAYKDALDLDLTLDRLQEEILRLRRLNTPFAEQSVTLLRIEQRKVRGWRDQVTRLVNRCINNNFCSPRDLRSRDLDIAWPTEMVKSLTGSKLCYGEPQTDIVRFALEGELQHPALIKSVAVTRVTKNSGEQVLGGNYQNILNISKTRKRFIGVIEDLYIGQHDYLLEPEQDLKYVLKIKDTFDKQHEYELNFQPEMDSELACFEY